MKPKQIYKYFIACFLIIGFILRTAFAQEPFSDYTVINAGNVINTEHNEWFPMVLHDGLTLFFSSDRPGGYGDLDIYVSVRSSIDEPWGEPRNMGPDINSPAQDHSVTVSDNGHWMVFASEKEGGLGSLDLYLSYRDDVSDTFGWGKPEHAGDIINSKAWDSCPLFHTEDSLVKIYLTSARTNDEGHGNAFVSTFCDGRFSPPVQLAGVNSATASDKHFEPVEGLIWSARDGGYGGDDLWIAHERSGEHEWTEPVVLGENINTSSNEGMPSITADKSLLVFHSDRPGGEGNYDIYLAKPEN